MNSTILNQSQKSYLFFTR